MLVVAFGLALVAVAPAAGAPGRPQAATPGPAEAIARPAPPTALNPTLAPPPGTTTLVSAALDKGVAGGPSSAPSISENGRWVAFASSAPDLVANDTNQAQDVFVRDRTNGTTVRVNLAGGGAPPAGGQASEPSISADGSAVAFTYIPPQPSGGILVSCTAPRVLLWHRETGETAVASLDVDDTLLCGSTAPSVSGDGRYVAFAGTVFPDFDEGPGISQVFVRDTVGGTTTLASPGGVAGAGAQGNANSRSPAISGDGSVVAFESDASNLVSGDTNQLTDVFLRTLPNGPTELVSTAPGAASNGPSLAAAVSADGSMVAFESLAQNLVAGVAPKARNVYARDRGAGATSIVSTSIGGAAATVDTGQAAISADGRIVAFASLDPALVAAAGSPPTGVGNAVLAAVVIAKPAEVYARDLVSGELIRVSEARGGGPAGQVNVAPTIGGNGRYIAFASNSPNLVRGDGNQVSDIFLRELPPVPTLAPNPVDFGSRALGAAGPPIAAIVTNAGWGQLVVRGVDRSGAAVGDYAIVLNGCEGRPLHRGESCPITLTFTPGGTGDRVAQLLVDHNGARPPATATLHGSASNATVEIKPPIGRPGIVAIVTGSGFPPNTEVRLTWSRGITPKLPKIVTDARGAFRVQMLVFHNDLVGRRDLVVSPLGPGSFPPFGTSFLVTEPPSQPPRFEPGDPAANRPPTLVFRH